MPLAGTAAGRATRAILTIEHIALYSTSASIGTGYAVVGAAKGIPKFRSAASVVGATRVPGPFSTISEVPVNFLANARPKTTELRARTTYSALHTLYT